MSKSITILDKDYTQWIQEISSRYRRSQIKAAVKVNEEMLRFYWSLGRDIVEMRVEERWGEGVIKSLSIDLQREIPNAKCFSRTNLYYMKKMYTLYSPIIDEASAVINGALLGASEIVQQVVGQNNDLTSTSDVQHLVGQKTDQNIENGWPITELVQKDIFSIPWGHHLRIIDKCSENLQEALFYIHQTVLNGWSRDMLLNFIDTGLYKRQGKALSNFDRTLPETTSDLAQEITKDPYNFAFTGITGRYNERLLKDKLLNNITQFLVELGTGFAYVGKEYRIEVGDTENFIDLLFYNLNLSCYVVVEVKIGKFEFADLGQLGGYVVSCNHILRKEGRDNPTIGLLICKEKDRIQAQYALESSSQPLGISEYELEKFYPEKVEGTIPTIEELEAKLSELKPRKELPGGK